jgi:uncharacterized protein YdhG (YjbR/CyaY superfamily)
MKTLQYIDIDDYIARFPADIRELLEQVRQAVLQAAPGAQETIKYNMPAFTLNGELVYFAAFKRHIGFFPAPTGVPEFEADLSKYKTGKGSVQFPLNKPMPLNLITRIVKYRMQKTK